MSHVSHDPFSAEWDPFKEEKPAPESVCVFGSETAFACGLKRERTSSTWR
jgi:hypothetical protein